jgi:hypothetical protein
MPPVIVADGETWGPTKRGWQPRRARRPGCAPAAGSRAVSLMVTLNILAGFVQIADSPARQPFISQLVGADDLSSAVSLNGLVV